MADKVLRSRAGVVIEVELRPLLRQKRRLGQPGMRVLGRGPRHGDGPLDQRGGGFRLPVGGGDDRLAAPDQHAQPGLAQLGALHMFDLAEPHRRIQRAAVDIDGIGLVGAPGAGFAHEVAQEVQDIVLPWRART